MGYTDDLHSLSHTKWNCKYHIVFAPKYRRKAFYESRRLDVGRMLRQLCEWKHVNIIEAEVCVDHVHMLVEIPPKMSVSGFVGYLKGKSSQMIFERWANARFKYRNRSFWCRGFLCRFSWKEFESHWRVYTESTKRRSYSGTIGIRIGRSVYRKT